MCLCSGLPFVYKPVGSLPEVLSRLHWPSYFRCDLLWLFSRWPQAELGLDTSGDGGGTVVSSCWTILIERWLRGFDAAAWTALVISSVLKEAMRGSWGWFAGIGIVDVILI